MSIRTIDISYRYGPRFGIVDITLEVPVGAWLGVIGANGSGKTTLLRTVAGMLTADSGRVLLDDEPLDGYTASRRARQLAYVPQSYQPVFEFSVEQTVLMGRMPWSGTYGGFEDRSDRQAADEAIELMELESLRHEPVTRLSGGELQRVMIARALAQTDRNIILDEPTSHLDIAHQQWVLERVRQRSRSRGTTVVASLHDLNLASIYCDRLAALSAGRLVAQGPPGEVMTPSMLEAVFGVELEIEPGVYGDSPAVRYRYRRGEVRDGR